MQICVYCEYLCLQYDATARLPTVEYLPKATGAFGPSVGTRINTGVCLSIFEYGRLSGEVLNDTTEQIQKRAREGEPGREIPVDSCSPHVEMLLSEQREDNRLAAPPVNKEHSWRRRATWPEGARLYVSGWQPAADGRRLRR